VSLKTNILKTGDRLPYAPKSEHREFVDLCLIALDKQITPLNAEGAKIMAIQVVQRVLRDQMNERGEKYVLDIIKYPNGRKDVLDLGIL